MNERYPVEILAVRAAVYDAAQALERDARRHPHLFAELLCDYYRAIGNSDEATFWNEVAHYMLGRLCVGANALTIIDCTDDE